MQFQTGNAARARPSCIEHERDGPCLFVGRRQTWFVIPASRVWPFARPTAPEISSFRACLAVRPDGHLVLGSAHPEQEHALSALLLEGPRAEE